MALTLTIINAKGGVGKTTIAILLAGELAEQGAAVSILDADRRQNALRWFELTKRAGFDLTNIDVISAPTGDAIRRGLDDARGRKRTVIFDLEGTDTELAYLTAGASHAIVIPAKLGGQDLAAAATTGTKTLPGIEREIRRTLPKLVVLNDLDLTTLKDQAFGDVEAFFAKRELRLATTRLWRRKPIRHLTTLGGTLRHYDDSKPVEQARAQARDLLAEVLSVVKEQAR